MIFTKENLSFRVLDMLSIDQRAARRIHTAGRPFSALSLRYETDATLRTEKQQLTLSPGCVTFFPAEADYIREATTDKMIVFHLEVYPYSGHQIDTLIPKKPMDIQALFEKALALWERGGAERVYRAAGLVNEIFALLHADCQTEAPPHSPLVQKAVAAIEEQYADPTLSMQGLAEELHICEAYLRRLFQRELGISPKQYTIAWRMKRAAALLATGYFSVAEVARQVGYPDEKHFSAEFHHHMGIPPSRYPQQEG